MHTVNNILQMVVIEFAVQYPERQNKEDSAQNGAQDPEKSGFHP